MTAAGQGAQDRDRDLLNILSCVAWSDGELSAEEKISCCNWEPMRWQPAKLKGWKHSMP